LTRQIKNATIGQTLEKGKQVEYKEITYRLRLVRKIKGWTLHEVEKHSNGEINAIALGSWERGDRKPTLERLLVLCNEVYKVPLSAVVSGSHDDFIKQAITTIYADPRER
jgi:transcriptional regulator with XRE-family HTH domain